MARSAVFVVAQQGFRDEELLIPAEILRSRGIKTAIASKSEGPALGKLGAQVEANLALPSVLVKDFDAIIFVGGPGARGYFEDEAALKLAQNFQKAGKIIGAICVAPSILANAGVLLGKEATAFPSEEENLRNRGADYTGMPLATDGLIVTAKGPEAAKDFGEKIAYLLED